MTDADRIRFGALLKGKRQELVRDVQGQTAELAIGGYEHEPINQVQMMDRRDAAATMLRRLSLTLSEVDDALRALSEGLYGACVECGKPISIRRLRIIPLGIPLHRLPGAPGAVAPDTRGWPDFGNENGLRTS